MHGPMERDDGERQETRKRESTVECARQRRVLCCAPPCAVGKRTKKGLWTDREGRGLSRDRDTKTQESETLSSVEMERGLAHVGEERGGGDGG